MTETLALSSILRQPLVTGLGRTQTLWDSSPAPQLRKPALLRPTVHSGAAIVETFSWRTLCKVPLHRNQGAMGTMLYTISLDSVSI